MHTFTRRDGILAVLAGTAAASAGLVLGTSESAFGAPTTPAFTKPPEAYASYVGQSTCSPNAKPGVVAFRDMVVRAYPGTGSSGIVRDCAIGGNSEHKEGRAWDWRVTASTQRAMADDLLGWLLATDSAGYKHALARRTGVMYIIWDRRIWKSYRASSGWQSYSGADPHTTHMHISFSWAGARKQTTFWTARSGSSAAGAFGDVGTEELVGNV